MRATVVLAPALLLAALVSACGGGGDSGSSGDSAGGGDVPEAASGSDAGRDRSAPAARRTAVRTEAVIYTASVELHAENVAEARLDVLAVVDRYGGEVAEEETASGEEDRLAHARMVLRVPSEVYPEARKDIEEVAGFGSSRGGREDVTTQVIDNEARIRAQAKGVRRLERLIGQAEDLSEVIALENQLTRRQADLDSLRSQQAWLSDQTALATITVNIDADPVATSEEDQRGFVSGLEDGWHGLEVFVTGMLTVLGAMLPFALLAALVGVPGWLATRVVRRRRTPAAPPDAG